MKTEDERIAKPGILGSVIFIFIFILVLLWFGASEDDPQGETREGAYGANDSKIQPISRYMPDSRTKQGIFFFSLYGRVRPIADFAHENPSG